MGSQEVVYAPRVNSNTTGQFYSQTYDDKPFPLEGIIGVAAAGFIAIVGALIFVFTYRNCREKKRREVVTSAPPLQQRQQWPMRSPSVPAPAITTPNTPPRSPKVAGMFTPSTGGSKPGDTGHVVADTGFYGQGRPSVQGSDVPPIAAPASDNQPQNFRVGNQLDTQDYQQEPPIPANRPYGAPPLSSGNGQAAPPFPEPRMPAPTRAQLEQPRQQGHPPQMQQQKMPVLPQFQQGPRSGPQLGHAPQIGPHPQIGQMPRHGLAPPQLGHAPLQAPQLGHAPLQVPQLGHAQLQAPQLGHAPHRGHGMPQAGQTPRQALVPPQLGHAPHQGPLFRQGPSHQMGGQPPPPGMNGQLRPKASESEVAARAAMRAAEEFMERSEHPPRDREESTEQTESLPNSPAPYSTGVAYGTGHLAIQARKVRGASDGYAGIPYGTGHVAMQKAGGAGGYGSEVPYGTGDVGGSGEYETGGYGDMAFGTGHVAMRGLRPYIPQGNSGAGHIYTDGLEVNPRDLLSMVKEENEASTEVNGRVPAPPSTPNLLKTPGHQVVGQC